MGKSCASLTTSRRVASSSKPDFERVSALTRPCTMTALSCDRWSALVKSSSPTAAFDITAWMKPEPSRICRKWSLPLDRRLVSQPLIVTFWPSYFAMSSIKTCITTVYVERAEGKGQRSEVEGRGKRPGQRSDGRGPHLRTSYL